MIVEAIVLAAGESKRMGRPKLTLPYGKTTVIETVLSVLEEAGVARTVVVLGPRSEAVYAILEHLPVVAVVNPRPETGMIGSIRWGLAHASSESDAYLIQPGDHPAIRSETIDDLVRQAERTGKGLTVPVYEGRRGHPLLVRSRHRQAILEMGEERGLNAFVRATEDDLLEVPVADPGVLVDLDTPEDYREATDPIGL